MEYPPFDHHHHRYAPPPPNNYPDDRPNLYPHHHLIPSVNFIPPPPSYPPLPPPPPPRPLPVPPPPQSYIPDFTFLDAPKPSYNDRNRFSPPQSRFSYQSNRFDYRTDSRSDSVRVPTEPSHRNPTAPEDHRRRVYSSNPQSESYYNSHGSERAISSTRFRDDTIIDGYGGRDAGNMVSQEQQVCRGSSNDGHGYMPASSVMNNEGSNVRIMDDYVEKYEPRYMPMPENERIWNHHGEEDPKWVMKGKKNELGHNDRISRDYEHESSKFNRAREGREEFKQVQKKSVLLRIGKPNNTHRNRNYDQHSSKDYLVESNSSNYRVKDKVIDKDRDHTGKDKRIEGDRERSPVDLDVSFKSNALVAKPVVTPSSPKRDGNQTQTRNRKIKRVSEFGSPLSKISERSTRSGSSPHGFDSPSSSEKATKQQTDKESVSNGDNSSLSSSVLDNGNGNEGSRGPLSFRLKKKGKLLNSGFGSLDFQLGVKDTKHVNVEKSKSSVTAPTSEKSTEQHMDEDPVSIGDNSSLSSSVLDKGNGNGGSKGPLSFRLQKKRKLLNPGFGSLDFNLGVKDTKHANDEKLKSSVTAPIPVATTVPTVKKVISSEVVKSPRAVTLEKDAPVPFVTSVSAKEEIISSEVVKSPQAVFLEKDAPIPVATAVPTVSSEVVKSPQAVILEKNAPIPVATPVSTIEEIISKEVVESLQAVVLEKDGSVAEIVNPHCTNSFSEGSMENKNLVAQDVSMSDDGLVKDFSKQPGKNENSLYLESDTHENISTDLKLSLGGTGNCDTSGHEQVEIQKAPAESYASFDAVNVSNSLCNEPVKMQEMSTTAAMNPSYSCSDEIIIVSSDRRDGQGSLDDVSRKEDGSQLFEGTSNQIFFDDVSRKEDESHLFEGASNQISFNGSREFSKADVYESTRANIVTEDNVTPVDSQKEHSIYKDEITEMGILIPSLVQTPSPDHSEPCTDSKDDLPPSLSIVSTLVNETGAFVTDSSSKSSESVPDIVSDTFLSQKTPTFPDSEILTSKSTENTISNSSIPPNDDNIFVKSVSKDVAVLNTPQTSIKENHLDITNTISSTSQGSNVKSLGPDTNLQGLNVPLRKSSSVPAVPRVLATRSPPVFTNPRINKTANTAKPRTWHRSSSSSASIPLPPKKAATDQNSYVRTGNSLVRKAAPVTAIASRPSAFQLKPPESRNSTRSRDKAHNTLTRIVGPSAPVVRPKTPPLSGTTSSPDYPTYSKELSSSPLEPLPASPVEENPALQTVSEDQIHTSSNSESQKVQDEAVTVKKIKYLMRKSNQLVAASGSDQSIQELDKTQASSSSDGYYKRRKNQLIRTSVGDVSANTDVAKVSKNSIKRQSGKGVLKKYKHLRSPSVWMLNSQSLGKDGVSLHQKLRPQLFPWKRSRNLGTLTNIIPSNSSSSLISRKLLLSRKRETIYTRSKHGFSLRISKLLSVGGSSLKWSKSIEKNSKKTNEEATLAVAAAEKRKREEHVTASATAGIKSKNDITRERIYRIGSVRYKMDPSGRTLQRISDEEPSTSMPSKEVTRKSYVPRRLKIGHDEYVRIGTGNQLVRNPKRRTRMLANEKVRWSLHTARSRLAKKKKFCQFFTRFGKCNKDDGKCPYIHDSSKIAVCTKFLKGLCSNPKCKLTHKVIPERMQDCSYFLQGMCSNRHCPYRHVNVNSAASICEGFLKGYCADGNECRKKHSYACPAFEATGACSEGAKCKLHHPKNQLKRKQQDSTEQHQKNSRGRYFGSFTGEESTPVSTKLYPKNDDMDDDEDMDGGIWSEEGKFAEYISLGFDDDEEEAGEVASDQRTVLISEPFGLGAVADEFDDELTKPTGIMNRSVADSPDECGPYE